MTNETRLQGDERGKVGGSSSRRNFSLRSGKPENPPPGHVLSLEKGEFRRRCNPFTPPPWNAKKGKITVKICSNED